MCRSRSVVASIFFLCDGLPKGRDSPATANGCSRLVHFVKSFAIQFEAEAWINDRFIQPYLVRRRRTKRQELIRFP